jgi:hypothetical protein
MDGITEHLALRRKGGKLRCRTVDPVHREGTRAVTATDGEY